MKMERGDIQVALVLIVGLVIAGSTVFWLTRSDTDYFPLFVRLDRVEGLDEATAVRLSGFPVGRIEGIVPQFTEAGSVDFLVELRIEQDLLADSALYIAEGTIARVNFPPIVGAAFIVLETPPAGGARLPPGSTITGVSSDPLLDHFQDIADTITAAVTEALTRTVTLLDEVEGTLRRVDGTVSATERSILEVLDGVSSAVAAAERLTIRIESEVNALSPMIKAALDSASAVLGEAHQVLSTVEEVIGTTSPELEAILTSLDSATQSLNFFVARISERPLRLLTGVGASPDTIDR